MNSSRSKNRDSVDSYLDKWLRIIKGTISDTPRLWESFALVRPAGAWEETAHVGEADEYTECDNRCDLAGLVIENNPVCSYGSSKTLKGGNDTFQSPNQ